MRHIFGKAKSNFCPGLFRMKMRRIKDKLNSYRNLGARDREREI